MKCVVLPVVICHPSGTQGMTGVPESDARAFASRSQQETRSPDELYDVKCLELAARALWYLGVDFPPRRPPSPCEAALRTCVRSLYFLGIAYSLAIRVHHFATSDDDATVTTELIAAVCSVALWLAVRARKRRIAAVGDAIVAHLRQRQRGDPKASRRSLCTQGLCLLTALVPVASAAVSTLVSRFRREDVDGYLMFLTLHLRLGDVSLHYRYIALFLLRAYDLSVCFVASQVSCLLLAATCHNVSSFVVESKRSVGKDASAGNFVERYRKVRRMVRDLEKAVSMPMFFATAFLLFQLFALMSNYVQVARLQRSEASTLVVILGASATTSIHLAVLVFRASRVEEAHKSLVRAAMDLPEEGGVQQALAMVKVAALEDSLQVTAWGMFPMRRGFFLTVVGTLGTYGVLLVQFA